VNCYLSYEQFVVLFPNTEIRQEDYCTFEQMAEQIAWQYLGSEPVNIIQPLQMAVGLIVQAIFAQGIRAKDLPIDESEGGVSRRYKDFSIIPDNAKEILDMYVKPVI